MPPLPCVRIVWHVVQSLALGILPASVLCLSLWHRKQPAQSLWPLLFGYTLQSAFRSGKMVVAKIDFTVATAPDTSVESAGSAYFERMNSPIFSGATAALIISFWVIACTATRLIFGSFVESSPRAMAFSTTSFAVGKTCAGRLWQSMQSIVRILSAGGSPLKVSTRNTLASPLFRLVTRIQGISCRFSSAA